MSGYDEKTMDELRELVAKYPKPRSALMPMLHLLQSVDGYVTPEAVATCAELVGITPAQVQGVATFYTMYRREPCGKHHIGVCSTALCAVMGGDAIYAAVEKKLGISEGQTTPDGGFTLERVECNAACDYAPVVMVDWEYMDNMTPEKTAEILDDLAAGREVRSTRGALIDSWRNTERVIAGFSDGRTDEGPSAGEPSTLGVRLAAAPKEAAHEEKEASK